MKKTTTIMKIEQFTGTIAIPVKFRAYGQVQWGWAFVKEFSLEGSRYKWSDDKEIITMEPYHDTRSFTKTIWKITFSNTTNRLNNNGFNFRILYSDLMNYRAIEKMYNALYLSKN